MTNGVLQLSLCIVIIASIYLPKCETGTTLADPCATNPCQNGGTCNAAGASYTCTCGTRYTGTTCSTTVQDPCGTSPCQNGGTCNAAGASYTCTCVAGYTGTDCDTTVQNGSSGNSGSSSGIVVVLALPLLTSVALSILSKLFP